MEFDKEQFEYLCKLIMLGDAVMNGDVEFKDRNPKQLAVTDSFYNLNDLFDSDYLERSVDDQWVPSVKMEDELQKHLVKIYGDPDEPI